MAEVIPITDAGVLNYLRQVPVSDLVKESDVSLSAFSSSVEDRLDHINGRVYCYVPDFRLGKIYFIADEEQDVVDRFIVREMMFL